MLVSLPNRASDGRIFLSCLGIATVFHMACAYFLVLRFEPDVTLANPAASAMIMLTLEAPVRHEASTDQLLSLGIVSAFDALPATLPEAPPKPEAFDKKPDHVPIPVFKPEHSIAGEREDKRTASLNNAQAQAQAPAVETTISPAMQKQMERYERVLASWLQQQRIYPIEARRAGMTGIARLRIRIDRQGHILSYDLAQRTGYSELDHAVLMMAESANPVPPVPETYPGGNMIEFLIPVRFSLE